jgi:hypothetical protein
MRPNIFLATIGRGSNGSNALEVTEDRAAVTAESQDNIINRVNNISQYGPSWHYVPGIGVAGTAYAEVPGTALGDLAFSRASSKTRTNAAGVVETIGNNVPPHDYRNADGTLSTFPRLNLEPQRTNLNLQSETLSNASWSVFNSTVTENNTTAPSGQLTADRLAENTANAPHSIFLPSPIITVIGTVYSRSIYAKPNGRNWIALFYRDNVTDLRAYFNIQNGTVGTVSAGITASIQAAGDGWYRCTIVRTATSAIANSLAIELASADNTNSYLGNGTSGVFLWGAQLEAGAYPTTYIPTTTAAVTRIFDLASKTGVSSLIGQTEGTLFLDFESGANDGVNNTFSINNGSVNRIIIRKTSSNTIDTQVRVAAVTQALIATSAITVNTRYKCAVGYKENDIVFYVNGVQIGVDTSSTIPACSIISNDAGSSIEPMYRPINQAALFPTRLTNAQLAQMTTL